MKRLGIIIPAYNCEKTLNTVIDRLPDEVWKRKPYIAIINDASTDETETIINNIARHHEGIYKLRHERNRGYGAAQKTGFSWMLVNNMDIIVLLHSDGQYAPEEMVSLITPLEEENADIALGSRILYGDVLQQGMPLLRFLGNRAISFIENKVFGLNFSEYHSGYVAYSSKALKVIPFSTLGNRFHFDGEMLLWAGKLGLRVKEIPISTNYDNNASSLRPIPYLAEIATVIIKYRRGGYKIK